MLSQNGGVIENVLGTNDVPLPWESGCLVSMVSCYGYHVGSSVLSGGSTRFLLPNTYARFDTTFAEIGHSQGPVESKTVDVVYRIQANSGQPAGVYESNVVYVVVPLF
jgi:hypothetical protein